MRQSNETIAGFQTRLATARSQLLSREPFLGFLALELPTFILETPDHEVHTAATDGRRYFYNYLWCRNLTDPELVFVVTHEVAHVMFLHALRREGRTRHLWNAACDYAVNGILCASTVEKGALAGIAAMPTEVDPATGRVHAIGLWEERFLNCPSEVIYDQLLNGNPVVGENWDQLLEPPTDGAAAANIARARRAVAKALIRSRDFAGRKGQGNSPSQWERWAEKGLHGTVRWQDRLRERILGMGGDVLSWNRPNPKYRPHGLYLPRYRGYRLPDILFAIDTSGSISNRFLGRMVGELNRLQASARNSTVRVLCCDTQVHVIGDFTATRPLDARIQSLPGGGGTDFRPVFEYAQKHSSFRHLVYLTDGYGTFPSQPPSGLKTLWVIPDNAEVEVPFGDLIAISME